MSGRQQWRSQTGDINEVMNMQDVADIATTPNTIYVPGADVMNMQESQTDWTDVATTPNNINVPGADVRSGDDVIKRKCCKRSKKLWKTIGIAFAFGVAIVLKGLQAMEKSYPWELIIRLDCLDLLSLLKERVLWEWMVRLGYLGLLDLQKKRVLWEWMVRLGYLGLLGLLKKRVLWEWMVRLGCLGLLDLQKKRVLWEWMVRLGYLGLLGLLKERVLWEWMVRLGCLGLLGLLKERVLWEWIVRLGYLGLLGLLKERVLWEWMVRLGYLGLLGLLKERIQWEWMIIMKSAWWRKTDGRIAAIQALLPWSVMTEDAALITCRINRPGAISSKVSRVLSHAHLHNCQYAGEASCMYRGTVSVTNTGKTCQRWDSQIPHEHMKTPAAYPSAGLEQNYCRNPDGEPGVWCFTTDPNSRWELCDVPSCVSCQYADGASYRGTVSVTKTGKTCQRWDSQTPHEHIKTPGTHPSAGLERNYCRNPDGELGVWCFTTDPNSRWELCDVPSCVSCQYADGAFYRGTVSVTKTGKTCQRWDSQTPHEHSMTGAYPSAGLERNYCRNPDGDRGVWCYTTDPSSRWELCDIPSCETYCGTMSGGRRRRSRTGDTYGAMNMRESQTDWTHIADKAATTPNPLYGSRSDVNFSDGVRYGGRM
ncbi:hypothetical protein Bbelb_133030 [Branchiostoma belcheri]|nr:hypothetical protein Bbelb_133030 [Branchiostoma belcheri]